MRKKVISVILAVFMIICQMWGMKIMTSAASDDVVSIGDVTVKSYAEIVQFLHNVADVTQSSTGQISIKLTKNIKGRIRFCIQDGNIVFDANGKLYMVPVPMNQYVLKIIMIQNSGCAETAYWLMV